MADTVADMQQKRLQSIDFLRGLVMVLMALDHVRDFITGVPFNPSDLTQTDSAYFLTRWITHFCAPVFIFLAGTSVGLIAANRSKLDLTKFLVSRGLWLIFIELTILSFAWTFNFSGFAFVLQVIFVIGLSMLVMAALLWLPAIIILAFGLILVFGHNLLDTGLLPSTNFTKPTPLWHILHAQGYTLDTGIPSMMLYPILPWIGIMPLGYVLAALYQGPTEARRKTLLLLGLGAIGLFILLRATNSYGDPTPWSSQSTALFTIWSFINTQKYPPSLLYLLMTLGPGLIVLAYSERLRGRYVDILVTFGRVPFFFYVLHMYFIHSLALILAEIQGLGWQAAAAPVWRLPTEYGLPLWGSWMVWIAVIAALYPACNWFAGVKARRKDWWLSYL